MAKTKVVKKKVTKKITASKKVTKKNDKFGMLDVAFVIDVTGSMQPYINEAKTRAADILKEIQKDGDLNIKTALIVYRDHPPQDFSFVTQVTDFTTIDEFNKALAKLSADGGGDHPEAVWDGVHELSTLKWRKNSDRAAYLIGDAPPHRQCLCGITSDQLIKELKENKVEVNAHSIAGEMETTKAFKLLVDATGGKITTGNAPSYTTGLYTDSLRSKSSSVGAARSLTAAYVSMGETYDGVASINLSTAVKAGESIGMSEQEVKETLTYLEKRDL